MVDVCDLTKFTASGKVLRLVMDIAAALERYKLVMEGPEGVRLRMAPRVRPSCISPAGFRTESKVKRKK